MNYVNWKHFQSLDRKSSLPDGFILKEIQPHQYLVAEHTGAMNRIYDTYEELYRNLLPNIKYEPLPTGRIYKCAPPDSFKNAHITHKTIRVWT